MVYGGPEDGPRYHTAAVCRRGHVESEVVEYAGAGEIPNRCARCGAEVLTACPSCETRIRGAQGGVYGAYSPPDFCDNCAAPFPWVSRQGRIYELMNLLDEEDLDPATELEVREQLEALTNPDIDEVEAERRWKRVREKAPAFWAKSGAQRILETVVTAAIKRQLDIQ
jgi:hypothetical protein